MPSWVCWSVMSRSSLVELSALNQDTSFEGGICGFASIVLGVFILLRLLGELRSGRCRELGRSSAFPTLDAGRAYAASWLRVRWCCKGRSPRRRPPARDRGRGGGRRCPCRSGECAFRSPSDPECIGSLVDRLHRKKGGRCRQCRDRRSSLRRDQRGARSTA